jgi:hypothetical protein
MLGVVVLQLQVMAVLFFFSFLLPFLPCFRPLVVPLLVEAGGFVEGVLRDCVVIAFFLRICSS